MSLANVAETAMDGSAIVLTVYGHKQLVTMEEFAGMPITEFAKLYTVSLQPTHTQSFCTCPNVTKWLADLSLKPRAIFATCLKSFALLNDAAGCKSQTLTRNFQLVP